MWRSWKWGRKKEEEVEEIKSESGLPLETAQLIFSIEDGKPNIEFKWNSEDEDTMAINIGMMLAELATGQYTEDIALILVEAIQDRPEDGEFINNICEVWKDATVEQLNDANKSLVDEPLVQPLRVFRQSSIFKGE